MLNSAKKVLQIIGVAAAYFLVAKFGLDFDRVSGFATLIWAPTGLSLAAIIILGKRIWPGIFLGAFLVNYLNQDATIFVAFFIAVGNTLQGVVGANLIRRFTKLRRTFQSPEDIFWFVIIGGFLATLISATMGVSTLAAFDILPQGQFWETWFVWWIGDMLGAIIVGPFLLILFRPRPFLIQIRIIHVIEALAFVIIFFTISSAMFFDFFGFIQGPYYFRAFLLFPFIVWAAVRFGNDGTIISTAWVALLGLWSITTSQGPFSTGDFRINLVLFLLFLATIELTGLVLSGAFSYQRRAAKIVLEEKNRYDALLQSIGEGVVATDISGNIILYNQSAADMLQTPPDEALNMHYSSVLRIENDSGELTPDSIRPIEMVMSKGTTFLTTTTTKPTYYYVRRDGSRFPVALSVSPYYIENQVAGVMTVFRDITPEKEVDWAKSEFISIASHQLRTPLVTVKWYAEYLLGDGGGELTPVQRQYIADMHHSNNRMIEVLEALLHISEIEMGLYSLTLEPVDLRGIIDDVIKEFAVITSDKQMQIETNYAKDLPRARADAKFFRIVIQNLISNSVKYSHKNTRIELSVDTYGDKVRVRVEDHGVGIAKIDQGRVFSKFYRGKNAAKMETDGSGLGLYIVKSILEHMNGDISFTSKEGKGTTFTVLLPKE